MNTRQARSRRSSGAAIFLFRLLAVAAIAGAAGVSGCGGGSGSPMSSSWATANGVAMVTLTDAPGDFLSYKLTVVSLKLTSANGTTIETLPAATNVDFAQLVDLSEVITARQVPTGTYTGVSMTVDYTGATIVVDDGAGGLTVPAANIMNGATSSALVSPNSQLTLTLKLASNAPLVISDHAVANLALDFNLSASNTVAPGSITSSTPASAVTVAVQPTLSASLTPDSSKQIRVRGKLVSVDTSGNSYTVNVRPFHDAMDDDRGQVVVHTTATTSFTLSGTTYTGSAGLTALAALGAGTLTAATGTFDTKTETFTATQVFAGTSVPGAGLDSVEGTVIARSGNVLTVSHAWTDERDRDDEQFSPKIAVTVASTTTVTEDGRSGSFGIQDISVGQHLQVFGTFGTDSSGNRTLDASSGSARLMLTPLWGQFISSASGVVTVKLQSLGGIDPAMLNFAGTGSSAANDATASAYQVSVPVTLPIPTLTPGSPIPFLGFVRPFGSAPPDFSAVIPVDFLTTNALLLLEWNSPSAANPLPSVADPFAAPLSASHVVITQSTLQIALVHMIRIGPEQLDPATVSTGLSFVPSTTAPMSFAIAHVAPDGSHTVDSFTSFADFVTALSADLTGMTAVRAIAAEGTYDQTSGVLTVNRMLVALSGG
jgi:hypothetical protein